MIEALADKISRYLVSIHASTEEDREVVALGLFQVFSTALQLVILLVSSVLLNAVPEIMVFTVMFGSLKRYAGGAHASRNWICLLVFTSITYAAYFLCGTIPAPAMPYAAACLSFAALALVLIRAPVAHPNNPKSPKRLKQLRRKAIYTALAQTAIVLASILFAPERADLWILCGAAGGFSAAFTLLLPVPAASGGEVKR